MKNTAYAILALMLACIATACSNDEQFRVNGTIEGKPSMNLRAGYYADGAYRTLITAVRAGEFEFFGSSSQPTLLEITDYEYHPICRLYVVNGETYTVKVDQAKPFAIEAGGSDINTRWTGFLRGNADALTADANAAVATYVAANPSDIVSTILLLTAYDSSKDPEEADSLMSLITPEARPSSLTEGYSYLSQRIIAAQAQEALPQLRFIDRGDSLCTFDPARRPVSVIAVSRAGDERTGSVVPALKRLRRSHRPASLAVLELSIDADTVLWKKSIASDSAAWRQGWAPGGLASMAVEPLGAPADPFFVVCDSTAATFYRGASAKRAEALVDSLLNR